MKRALPLLLVVACTKPTPEVVVDASAPVASVSAKVDAGPAPLPEPEVLAQSLEELDEIAIDADAIYWLDRGHGVTRMPKKGGAIISLVKRPAEDSGHAIAVDATDVYWASNAAATAGLWRAKKGTGTEPTAIDKAVPAVILLDAAAVYSVHDAKLARMPRAGGAARVLGDIPEPFFGTVVIDATTVFWADPVLHTMPTAGGAKVDLAKRESKPAHLQVDDTHLYWAEGHVRHQTIARVPRKGGAVEKLAESGGRCLVVTALVLDATNVYYACEGEARLGKGGVWRVAKSGGTPEPVADHQDRIASLAVDDGYLYWSHASAELGQRGRIVRLPKPR